MVQVDFFWSYAIGASFALAAATQILHEQQEQPQKTVLDSRFFVWALLFVAVIFAPSGICLLWAFPSWETMHLGDRDLPAWLVTAFAVTNVTQGVLGFWVTWRLVLGRSIYGAFLQPLLGYFALGFTLIHGWDGTGYKRFFSATGDAFLNWSWTNIPAWFISEVALTLYAMGLVMLPLLLIPQARWLMEGYHASTGQMSVHHVPVSIWQVVSRILLVIGVGGLAPALVASIFVWIMGWPVGLTLFLIPAVVLVFWRRGPWRRLFGTLLPQFQ
jgi:hypothetical protein